MKYTTIQIKPSNTFVITTEDDLVVFSAVSCSMRCELNLWQEKSLVLLNVAEVHIHVSHLYTDATPQVATILIAMQLKSM